MKLINRIGETKRNNQGLNMTIIAYQNKRNITILFDDEYVVNKVEYSNFKKGTIKNPYHPSVYGIGYIGEGKYKTGKTGNMTIQYKTWICMLQRCYSEKSWIKHPTYKGCIVYESWLNFQNFCVWFDENYYEIDNEKMHLDKDILIKGNKIYSPETCVFVPQRINCLFSSRNNCRGNLPIGVHFSKNNNKFRAQLNKGNETVNLGCYNISEDAFNAYKQAKETYIKKIADEYKSMIPQNLYNAMYKYEVKITD